MNTYDDQVNDYLRAVEQALDGVPVGRRDELLADLSDHIAAKLAEARRAEPTRAVQRPEAEVRSVLDLLGDPQELAADLEAAEFDAGEPSMSGHGRAGFEADEPGAAGDGAAAWAGDAGAPIEINPGRKAGALIWVLMTIAMVSLLCVGVVLGGVLLLYARH